MKYDLVLKSDGKVYLDSYKDENGDEIEENIREVDYSELSINDKKKHIAHLESKDKKEMYQVIYLIQKTLQMVLMLMVMEWLHS